MHMHIRVYHSTYTTHKKKIKKMHTHTHTHTHVKP
jgi:hypothetical protein